MRAVRSLLEEIQGIDRVEVCEEFVRSIQRYLIELRVVRNLVEELRGIR